MRSRLLALACGLLILCGSNPLLAWSNKGHMVVAFVAYKRLDPAVRARVDALLKLNPHFSRWLTMIPATVPAADRSLAVFMIAATWPDQIKSDPTFHDDGTQNGNVPDGPQSSQNIGFADKPRHKYWHFMDTPFSTWAIQAHGTVQQSSEEDRACASRACGSPPRRSAEPGSVTPHQWSTRSRRQASLLRRSDFARLP